MKTTIRNPTAKRNLHVDIETYSSQPLPKCGVYRYSQSSDFQILIVTYGFDHDPLVTVDMACGENLPAEFLSALDDPAVLKIAHNAQFERVCFSKYLGHWLDPHQWRCSMVMASYMTLPLKLADVAVALNLTERKMEEGKDLIRYFSVPCKPTKANGGRTRNLPGDAPEKWEVYKQYNHQDVETERAVVNVLEQHPLPESEWELYALDQIINDRGVRIDKQLVRSAMVVDTEYTQKAYQRAQEITGLDNPSSVVQLKAWLADQDTSTGGLVVYEDKFAYSHHATDPASGKLSCGMESSWTDITGTTSVSGTVFLLLMKNGILLIKTLLCSGCWSISSLEGI